MLYIIAKYVKKDAINELVNQLAYTYKSNSIFFFFVAFFL